MALVTACSLPRGAALQSEVLKESDAEHPTFQVVPVTRAAISEIQNWPATGWHGHYHWLNGSHAPSSTIIKTGDHVNLMIWDSQEVSLLTSADQKSVEMKGIEVSPGGSIFVPYINTVVVSGLTAEGARSRIQRKLEDIIPSAQVQLTIDQGQYNSVDLVGGVENPGTFPLPGRNYSILSLIAQAGGISASLNNPLVRLIRGGGTYEIPAADLLSSAAKNTILRGNDKIIVEEDKRRFTALGASGTEDLIAFPKEHVTALEALSLIGGLSDNRADPKGVLILREYAPTQLAGGNQGPNLQQVIFSFDLTNADGLFAARKFLVHPDDTVLATESPITKARTIFGLFGSAFGLVGQAGSVSNL